ncbi:uncharacterized protein FOMMEDRAFT_28406 [Fomitiporia mediterranea MF3/22]|uniref:uncharacterized protein n=1 Tax=Fomitiporia mediterranea (strain MF3/22) TaxID=694068 RepID=UPI0004407AE3|nr:uncharacterized protein FOMMEDRAFT_28406 [Fomitiporia mediterranea MF3/22]EJD02701.1 hypothetical protein FOMMEDRAFT_28406 [Fomitiporia mediterranea MF3/22]
MLSARPPSNHYENNEYARTQGSKTPGRALKGRAGLQENVLHNGSMTANPKEKRVTLQTPFRQGSNKFVLQDTHASSKAATFSTSRPLGDKTPKPNRQSLSLFSPGPRTGKTGKFELSSLQDEIETQSPNQPPSSSRKKLRQPRVSKSFQTPVTKGDHWNVSDVSIEAGNSTLGEIDEGDANEPDDSEPEYMPPRAKELPYEPPFEMPNYKEVGQMLRTLAYSYPEDDTPYVYRFDSEDLLKGCEWSVEHMKLSLPESDDDEIFGPRKQQPKVSDRTKSSSTTGPKRTVSRPDLSKAPRVTRSGTPAAPPPRPATSTAIRAPDKKLVSMLPRPGTSASNTRPQIARAVSGGCIRPTPSIANRAVTRKPGSDDILASHFVNDLEPEDDFRFAL